MFPKAITLHIKRVDGQVLVHDDVNRNIHVVNETAATVLELCDGTRSLDAIVDSFVADAGVPREKIAQDVSALLDQYRTLRLLE